MGATTGQKVLVTGGSGFIAGHCIEQLLGGGHRVRATLRSLAREPEVRAVLGSGGVAEGADLEFVAADLTSDAGWAEALHGVDAVLHVASPVRPGHVADEDEVIKPAREGTLRVLRAASDAGVHRVVLTSAFHAAGFGHPHDHGPFTEADWSPLHGPGMDAYGRSKVLAERAAWEFAGSHPDLALTTLLPVAVMGPLFGDAVSGSNHLLLSLLTGEMARYPDLFVPVVDVRDVAAAHVAALGTADAAGERFLIASGEPAMSLAEIAGLLRRSFPDATQKVPTKGVPDLVVRLAARFRPEYRGPAAELGFRKQVVIDKARRVLGLDPRPSQVAVVDAAASMIARGLVHP